MKWYSDFFLNEIILFQCPCYFCHAHLVVLTGCLFTALPRKFAWGLFTDFLFFIWELRTRNSDWKSYCFISDMELIFITFITQALNIVQYLECLKCTDLHSHKVNMFIAIFYCELNSFPSDLYTVVLGGDFSAHRMHTLCTAWQCKTILCCTALETSGLGLGGL